MIYCHHCQKDTEDVYVTAGQITLTRCVECRYVKKREVKPTPTNLT